MIRGMQRDCALTEQVENHERRGKKMAGES